VRPIPQFLARILVGKTASFVGSLNMLELSLQLIGMNFAFLAFGAAYLLVRNFIRVLSDKEPMSKKSMILTILLLIVVVNLLFFLRVSF